MPLDETTEVVADTPAPDDSVRGALEAAFDAQEPPTEPVEAAKAPASTPTPTTPPGTPPESPQTLQKAAPQPGAPTTPAQPSAGVKAPPSWKPAAREKWAAMAPDVQQEVMRREKEIENGLREASSARKLQQEFERTIAPFQQFIQADNSTPLRAVQNLMQTAATLRVGTPMQKAQVAAEIIKNFGIDVQTLDNLLAGNMVQPDPLEARLQAALAPMHQMLQQQQDQLNQRQERLQGTVATELDAFAQDPANEFFEDVRSTMADLLDVASAQGKTLDLQTAYKRAILMHDDIAPIVAQRDLKARAAEASAAANKARSRAVSVTGAPSADTGSRKAPSTVRGAIEEAIERLESEA